MIRSTQGNVAEETAEQLYAQYRTLEREKRDAEFRGRSVNKSYNVQAAQAAFNAACDMFKAVLNGLRTELYGERPVRSVYYGRGEMMSVVDAYAAYRAGTRDEKEEMYIALMARIDELVHDEDADRIIEEERRRRILSGTEEPTAEDSGWLDEAAAEQEREAAALAEAADAARAAAERLRRTGRRG